MCLILLSVDEMHVCRIQKVTASFDHSLIAYSADFTGNETYALYVIDAATGKELESGQVQGLAGGNTWGADNQTLFYTTEDAAKRPWKVSYIWVTDYAKRNIVQ